MRFRIRPVAFLICLICCIACLPACEAFFGPAFVEISPEDPSIDVGATQQFRLRAIYTSPASSEDKTGVAEWSSSNTAVATISKTGLATGIAPGVTVIKGRYREDSDDTTLTVRSP
jgi:hypothetical protein